MPRFENMTPGDRRRINWGTLRPVTLEEQGLLVPRPRLQQSTCLCIGFLIGFLMALLLP